MSCVLGRSFLKAVCSSLRLSTYHVTLISLGLLALTPEGNARFLHNLNMQIL